MNDSTPLYTVILSSVVISALISSLFSFWTQNKINETSRTLEYLYRKLEKLHAVKKDIISISKTKVSKVDESHLSKAVVDYGADSLILLENIIHDLIGFISYDKLRTQRDKLNKINRYVLQIAVSQIPNMPKSDEDFSDIEPNYIVALTTFRRELDEMIIEEINGCVFEIEKRLNKKR